MEEEEEAEEEEEVDNPFPNPLANAICVTVSVCASSMAPRWRHCLSTPPHRKIEASSALAALQADAMIRPSVEDATLKMGFPCPYNF